MRRPRRLTPDPAGPSRPPELRAGRCTRAPGEGGLEAPTPARVRRRRGTRRCPRRGSSRRLSRRRRRAPPWRPSPGSGPRDAAIAPGLRGRGLRRLAHAGTERWPRLPDSEPSPLQLDPAGARRARRARADRRRRPALDRSQPALDRGPPPPSARTGAAPAAPCRSPERPPPEPDPLPSTRAPSTSSSCPRRERRRRAPSRRRSRSRSPPPWSRTPARTRGDRRLRRRSPPDGSPEPASRDLAPRRRRPDLSPDLSRTASDGAHARPRAPLDSESATSREEEEIPTLDGEEIIEEVAEAPGGPSAAARLRAARRPRGGRRSRAPVAEPRRSSREPPLRSAGEPRAPPPPPSREHRRPRPLRRLLQRIAGAQRVVVHTLEGQVKRGFLQDADLAAPALPLAPRPAHGDGRHRQGEGGVLHARPRRAARRPEGNRVRVTFRDGRQVAGFSPDYTGGRVRVLHDPGRHPHQHRPDLGLPLRGAAGLGELRRAPSP